MEKNSGEIIDGIPCLEQQQGWMDPNLASTTVLSKTIPVLNICEGWGECRHGSSYCICLNI